MNKIVAGFITIFLIFFNNHIYTQKYGLQGGVNFSDMMIKDITTTYSTNMQVGFNLGITIDYKISKQAEFEIGIIYESRGTKSKTFGINMTYMDIPLLLKVGPTFGKIKIYGAAGPYFGIGLSGFCDYAFVGHKYSGMFKWGNDEYDLLKRPDFGAKFGIGVHGVHFNMAVYYSYGIINIITTSENGIIVHNRGTSISVGYMF